MHYGSVCAGIEAASVAWDPLGWKASWYSEIEPFPCSVLAHHYPDVPNLGDMTLLENHEHVARSPLDLLVGGTPCQGFSVAGLRKGLADDRSNLALAYVRLALRRRPRWVVWENVPGAFTTSKGQDFGCFLSGLCGVDVSVPEGGWKNSGVIVGAAGHYGLAWRVLDAQYAGVPQRRRRIFLVGNLGDWRRAAAVLFERESLHGHPPPRRQSRQDVTYDVAPCLAASGRGFERTGDSRGQDCLIPSTGDIAHCLNAGGMGRQDYETETLIAHSLRADGFDASEDGTGRGTPLVPVSFNLRGREGGSMLELDPDSLVSMRAASGGSSRSYIAFSAKDSGDDAGEIAPTLRAGGHSGSHGDAGVMPAVAYRVHGEHSTAMTSGGDARVADPVEVARCLDSCGGYAANQGGNVVLQHAYAFSENQRAEVVMSDTAPSLKVGGGKPVQGYPAVCTQETADALTSSWHHSNGATAGNNPGVINPVVSDMAVRRLTPKECERLQGFPDDYTAVPHRGKPAADGPRYKALGNSMAVPCMRWIGERIQLIEDTCRAMNLPS